MATLSDTHVHNTRFIFSLHNEEVSATLFVPFFLALALVSVCALVQCYAAAPFTGYLIRETGAIGAARSNKDIGDRAVNRKDSDLSRDKPYEHGIHIEQTKCVGQYLEVDLRVGNLIAHKRHFQRTLLNLQYVRLVASMEGRAFSSVTCVHAVSGNIPVAIHYSADEKTAKKASRVRRQRVTAPVTARRPPAHHPTPRTNVSFVPL
ncbi:hypothetical protein CBL_11811 [Carabus blaptoides fortunei]